MKGIGILLLSFCLLGCDTPKSAVKKAFMEVNSHIKACQSYGGQYIILDIDVNVSPVSITGSCVIL